MKAAVVVFPGSNCEFDVVHALQSFGVDAEMVWHRETEFLDFDGVVLPGGFAHGDYLRTGAIARFSPAMASVTEMAFAGKPILGICNGFQILCEAGLLPGALIANRDLKFICRPVELEVVETASILTRACQIGDRLVIPLNSYEGNYVDPSGAGRVVLRYTDNPNGSQGDAAAIANDWGNVVGIMPHPERASEEVLDSIDGRKLLAGFVASLEGANV